MTNKILTIEKKASLAPGEALEIRFTPGAAKSVSAEVAAGATVMIEICDAAGKPLVHGDLLPIDGVSYQPPAIVELIARVTNRAAVPTFAVLTLRYPSKDALSHQLVPADKLESVLRGVLEKELNPRLTIEGNHLKITGDRSLLDIAGDHADIVLDLSLTVSGVELDAECFRLAFEGASDDFPSGALAVELRSKRAITISRLGGKVQIPQDKPITLRVGLNVFDGLHLKPLDLRLPALDNNFIATVGFFLHIAPEVRSTAIGLIQKAIDKLEAKGTMRQVTTRLQAAMQMLSLHALTITPNGFDFEYEPMPPQDPVPAVVAAPKPRSARLEHLIIVMLENRSFDHMMADILRGRTDARYVLDGYTEHIGTQSFTRSKTTRDALGRDPSHDSAHQDMQAAGKFVASFLSDHTDPHEMALAPEVLAYQARENLKFFDFLAREFVICDDWRAALRGHTWPNRLYSLSAASKKILKKDADGNPFETYRDNPGADAFEFYTLPTICDVLEAQGVDWAYYKDDFAFLELYRRWVFDQTRVRSRGAFQAAIAANKLPTVCWYEPNISDFGKSVGNDDHPPISVLNGQRFLAELYGSLCKLNTKNWLLAITYDESGGFYDHLPPVAVDDDHERRQGFRVPAFLVSPWLDRGRVCPTRFDHTSLIRTVLDNFCQPEPIFQANKRIQGTASFAGVLEAGSGFSVSSPRAMPVFAEAIPTPAVTGLELGAAPEEVPPQQPLYGAFEAAKQQLQADRAAPQPQPELPLAVELEVAGAPVVLAPAPVVRFEGLYIQARTLPPELAALGWTARPWFTDSIEARPPQPLSVDVAWDLVHDLRARHPGVLIDPLWETEIDDLAPEPGLDLAEAAEAPPAKNWHLDAVRARPAWERALPAGRTNRGAGIVIGHLDTGYRDHPDLKPMLLPQYGWDVVDDDDDPHDEMIAGTLKFPGHGTSTASIIGSRGVAAADVMGTAPAVTAIPFRISKSVVHMSMSHMVRAIQMAVERDVHVISLSAGGLWSAALHRAVRDAVDAGVIVVAAAGNYTEIVVWPARFDEVISCGALNAAGDTWRWSNGGRGAHVTVMAPGEAVWVLRPTTPTSIIVDPGSGTSFATACTAGAIANWLGFHGRDALIARYGRPNLARVAKQHLRALTEQNGEAGPLDIEKLLAAELPDPLALGDVVPDHPPSDPLAAAMSLEIAEVADAGPYADELAFHEMIDRLTRGRGVDDGDVPLAQMSGLEAAPEEPRTRRSARLALALRGRR